MALGEDDNQTERLRKISPRFPQLGHDFGTSPPVRSALELGDTNPRQPDPGRM